MEVTRDNETMVVCPYNPAHHIRIFRMEIHLTKCRKQCPANVRLVSCDFNSLHRIPEPELQYHHRICSDRRNAELHVFGEETNIKPLPVLTPSIPPPVDSSWDDVNVPTYNPKAYCDTHLVLRQAQVVPPSVRKEVRLEERNKFSRANLRQGTDVKQAEGMRSLPKKKPVTLPDTPLFTAEGNIEKAPPNVARMMAKVSVVPKEAVIPKLNNMFDS